jgi:hypothetical protein
LQAAAVEVQADQDLDLLHGMEHLYQVEVQWVAPLETVALVETLTVVGLAAVAAAGKVVQLVDLLDQPVASARVMVDLLDLILYLMQVHQPLIHVSMQTVQELQRMTSLTIH